MEAISREITNDEAAEMLFNRIKEKDRIEKVKHLDFYNDAFDILREEKKDCYLLEELEQERQHFLIVSLKPQ